MNSLEHISLAINRDSVHAGDDLDSHASTITVVAHATVIDLLEKISESDFLPWIAGGEATWIIDCSSAPNGSLGVIAQQWKAPKLTIPPETFLRNIGLDDKANLYFRYLCQADPDVIFSCVRAGKELPNKYR